MGYKSVSDAEARKAIKKYYNIDISEITSIWQGTNFVDMYSKMELLKNGWNSERLWR